MAKSSKAAAGDYYISLFDPFLILWFNIIKTWLLLYSKCILFTFKESTATMSANVGRASYVNAGRLTKPDPGAIAVSIWLNAIAETLQQLD